MSRINISEVNRQTARLDLKDCRVAVIDDQVFSVTREPLDPITLFENWGWSFNVWNDPDHQIDKTIDLDYGDPTTLAHLIDQYHDYPSADQLGGMIAD